VGKGSTFHFTISSKPKEAADYDSHE
jgi:hypothetical protein